MEELMKTKIFKVTVERLLLNGGQTLYMVGWSLLIGTIIGMILALILVLLQKRRIGGEPTVIYDRTWCAVSPLLFFL